MNKFLMIIPCLFLLSSSAVAEEIDDYVESSLEQVNQYIEEAKAIYTINRKAPAGSINSIISGSWDPEFDTDLSAVQKDPGSSDHEIESIDDTSVGWGF